MKGTTRFCIIFGVLFLFTFDSIAQLTSASIIDSRPLNVQPAYQQTVRLLLPSEVTNPSTLDVLLTAAGRHSTQDDVARKLIAQFRDATDPNLRKILAMQIFNDYTARMLLKNEFIDLGKEFFSIWFKEGDGLAHQMIARAKGKLTGVPQDVLDMITVIQNERSIIEMRAPMDLDIGVMTKTREDARKIMKQLGGAKKVAEFETALEEALEQAYTEIYSGLKGPGRLDPRKAFISGTTAWHAEAYGDARVLREGGVAGENLVQQTADVTKTKAARALKRVDEGVLTLEEAMTEAMRGTAKDLDKVDAVFKRLEKLTGVLPEFRDEQAKIAEIMRKVRRMEMSGSAANAQIIAISGGRLNAFTACDNLIDTMEAAWRLRKVKPQERLLWLFAELLDDPSYDKSIKTLVEGGNDLPEAARKIVDEVQVAGKARTLSINGGTIEQFMDDIAKDFPGYKISKMGGNESLRELVKVLESGAEKEDLVAILGKEKADQMSKIREYMTPKVKSQMKLRYSRNKFLIWELDQKSREVLFGDTGKVGLGVDAGVGIAMAFWQTASIMDRTDLSPEEESRLILNAWGTALPIIGDIAMGLIEGTEGIFEGDKAKIGKGLLWLAIGASGFVPALQVPAMIAGLTLASVEAGLSYFDIRRDKQLLEAWIASGKWDEKNGLLLSLNPAIGDPREISFEGLIRNGGVGYKVGLEGITIRDSIYMYAERNGLDTNAKRLSYLQSLKALYPEFEFEKALREPLVDGKKLFAAVISGTGGQPSKAVEMLMFVRAKSITDAEVNRAAQSIQSQVEAEYQARFRVGEAARIYEDLKKVGERLNLPLFKNVNDIFDSFGSFVTELAKNPWVRESLARRRLQLAEKYLKGYLEIEGSLKAIGKVFDKAGVPPPRFNLSGFLDIDAPRINDLEAAYTNKAIRETGMDVQKLHREISGDSNYFFNTNAPDACDTELFKKLANIRVRLVEAEDRKLLFEQWLGKKSAANVSRDESLRKAQQAVDAAKGQNAIVKEQPAANVSLQGVITMPLAIWDGLCESYEAAYAWTNGKIEGTGEAYNEAVQVQTERIAKLNTEYTDALSNARQPMVECLVKTPTGKIELSVSQPKQGESLSAKIAFTKGATPTGGQWSWTSTGGIKLTRTTGEVVDLIADSNGTLVATLRVATREITRFTTAVEVKPGATPSPSPSGKVQIVAPAEVTAAEKFTVQAKLPPDIAGAAKSFGWYGSADLINWAGERWLTAGPEAVMMFGPKVGRSSSQAFDPNQKISFSALDAQKHEIGRAEIAIKLKPIALQASAMSSWDWSADSAGIHLKRKPASKKARCGDRDCTATVAANIDITWCESCPANAEELKKTVGSMHGGFLRSQYHGVTPGKEESITIAGYTGSFANKTPQYYVQGNSEGLVDLAFPAVTSFVGGVAMKDGIAICFRGTAWGGGTRLGESGQFWFDDSPFVNQQGKAAYSEMMAILRSVTLGPDANVKQLPYKGPALDGSDLPSLKLVLSPNNKKLRKGDVVNVQVVIEHDENVEKPLRFEWTGDHAGNGANVQFLATKPGKQTLTVNVTDVGSAAVEFEVEDLQAKITQVSPTGPKIMVGTPVSFSAKLISGGTAVSGNYVYRWQPTPEVKFEPIESAANQSKAVFSRPGVTKVWVQILEKKGDVLQTLAESDQIEIEVINPTFKITFNPQTVTVGKEVKAAIEVTPADLKDIDFRWEVTANGKQTLVSQDKREITLIPLDTKPVTVTAHARVPFTGDDLGTQTATITAQKLDIKVSVLGAEGPKPQVWKEGVGLVPLETGIAVHQFVGLRADVTPPQADLRYEWSLNEDSHFAGNNLSQQIRVSRSQTGTGEATVIVRDKNGLELGRGTGTFDVTVSQAEIDNGKKRASAAEKTAQAKALVAEGKLDEGIGLADEAAGLDPKNAETATLANKWKSDRSTIEHQLSQVRSLMDQKKFADAAKPLAAAKQLHPKYAPVVNAEKELASRSAKDDSGKRERDTQVKLGDDLYDKANYPAAIDAYNKALAADPGSAAAYAGRCLAKRGSGDTSAPADCDKALQLDPNNANAYRGRSMIKRGNNDLQGAVADATRAIELSPNIYRNYLTRGLAKTALKDINGALADYNRSIELNPNYPPAYDYRGTSKLNLKDYRGALADLDQYLTAEPKDSNGHVNRGVAKENLGDLNGAIADYETAVALDPKSEIATANLARLKKAVVVPQPTPPGLPNLALKQPAKQSSTSRYSNAEDAQGAVDGTIGDDYGFHTESEANPWWQVDLGSVKSLTEIRIFNRKGCCWDRARTIQILLSNDGVSWNRVYNHPGTVFGADGTPLRVTTNGLSARFVRLQLAETNYLHLAEVEVYGTDSPVPVATPTPASKVVELLSSMNNGGVSNSPTAPSQFDTNRPYMITSIMTYHWNNGRGTSRPGTISIRASNGTVYGPYTAAGLPTGAAANAFWEVKPNILLPAGRYVIVDSDPASWAQNAQSGGKGFALIKGYAVADSAPTSWLGTWYREGDRARAATVRLDASGRLVFTNEFGGSSTGRLVTATTALAEQWEGGLQATLTNGGRRIEWANGTTWQR